MANVDAALEQQVLDIPERQWEPHIRHHQEADHLGRGCEVAERAAWPAGARRDPALPGMPL